jgi:drug/metabolite transporter (DMT)-like permease
LYAIFRPNLRLHKKDLGLVVAGAIIGITIHIPVFFYGLSKTSAINAGVISSIAPILVLIAAAIFLKEAITKSLLIAAILGTIGVSIIIAEPLAKEGISPSFIGNLLLLISLIFSVSYEIICKKLFKTYSPMSITFYSFFIGGILLFPLMCLTHQIPSTEILHTPNFYIGIPFGIIFPSILAYSLWQWGLSKLPASRVGFFVYLDPVIGGICAFFFLGETVEPAVVAGGLFILSSLYFAETKHPYHHLIDIMKHRETEYKNTK